ncbi:MAG: WXG100 family type VII secretion target [Coriobacteriales bacterium]|jgi:uncharacterized protein YukE|nr:WXG100 family type VII secretion target [Coriobacteriales bacterium]
MAQVKSIDTKQFDATLAALKRATSAFEKSRKDAESATDALLKTWRGDGRDAFVKVYDKLRTEMGDDLDNLKVIRDDLTAMKQSYVDWDSGVAVQLKP